MTALVLVVDDLLPNVKLLEAKLVSEYYDVITAFDGFAAIDLAKERKPDIILLDVMMPEMDGFETCVKLKQDPETAHIPVVMVTALNEPSDRVRGLESGADDFLTKPVNDVALFARVRSLVRMKVLMDELRLRGQTGIDVGIGDQISKNFTEDVSGSKILVIDDDIVQSRMITDKLSQIHQVDLLEPPVDASHLRINKPYDLIIVSMQLFDADGLRLATHIKSQEETRHVPILMLVDEDDERTLLKGLEMGINDYIIVPIDSNELDARIKTQIRRKKYQDALKNNYHQSVSMAITDGLTGLYNRHYLDTHLRNLVQQARQANRTLGLMIMDMDHFKQVNDTYGHDAGDEVLKQFAQIIVRQIRGADLAARYGGEEFVVLMPETDFPEIRDVAERIRSRVESYDFVINHPEGSIKKTVSIGVAALRADHDDDGQTLLKRADQNLYEAKNSGRNRVICSDSTDDKAARQA